MLVIQWEVSVAVWLIGRTSQRGQQLELQHSLWITVSVFDTWVVEVKATLKCKKQTERTELGRVLPPAFSPLYDRLKSNSLGGYSKHTDCTSTRLVWDTLFMHCAHIWFISTYLTLFFSFFLLHYPVVILCSDNPHSVVLWTHTNTSSAARHAKIWQDRF